jgi:cytochrome c biogenesis protein CcmG, thiol:disulfide interchange protein DsbE
VKRRTTERLLWMAAIGFPVVAVVVSLLAVRVHDGGSRVPPGAVIQDFVATPVPEDRPAPAFDLPSLTGGPRVSLGRYGGRVVVLNIWASWCDPCRREAADLVRMAGAFRARGVVTIGVDHEDGASFARQFANRYGISYPLGSDPRGSVAASYGAVGLPTTYVIDGNGVIRYRLLGRATSRTLGVLLNRLLTAAR